jgi:hypothetical protein
MVYRTANKTEDVDAMEVSHVAASSNKIELLCCGVVDEVHMSNTADQQKFPTSIKLLQDHNIWIGDSGASVDMTPHPKNITDCQPSNVSVHAGYSQHGDTLK